MAMTDWKLANREQRGMLLAAMVKITQRGQEWVVPSQSGDGSRYTVNPDEHSPSCSCPDFEVHGCTCKHIYAVRIVRQRELFADGSETITESVTVTQATVKRPTYKQEWSAYNRAQTTEKDQLLKLLGALCDGIKEEPQQGRGRPRIPLRDAVFACCLKVYGTLSGRRSISDLRDAHEKGHVSRPLHFNTIFKYLEDERMEPVLRDLIARSSEPLSVIEHDFACDSTGFMVSRFDRWFDEKYGTAKVRRQWVKTHIAIGVRTHVVTAVEIHEQYANDSPIMPALLDETAKRFQIVEVSADKAYASEANFQAIEKHGATGYIPFKSYTTGAVGGLFQKAFHYFNLHRDTFLAHYHKRSNVESAIMSIKTKFGDAVRSKTGRAMRNEVLCKILSHNICCLIESMEEFGIPVDFGTSPTVPMAQPQLARLG
jgi:transposase